MSSIFAYMAPFLGIFGLFAAWKIYKYIPRSIQIQDVQGYFQQYHQKF